ncbi:MAG TPA: hypothetical protein VMZ27_13760 [Candidatus Saccharimonadales bacterium]|nr:hypothetical protein [Candidatus Saccharimonadales bacterium]
MSWKPLKMPWVICCGMGLLVVGFLVYLGTGGRISVGHFRLECRQDGRLGFKQSAVSEQSWAGATVRTGRIYFLGPFQLADWKGYPQTSGRLTETNAREVASSMMEKAGNHLDDFKEPHIVFHTNGRQWTLFWEAKKPVGHDGHLTVVIDDTTGKMMVNPTKL